jgi:hypothetical protein
VKYIVTSVVQNEGDPRETSWTEVFIGEVTQGQSPRVIAEQAIRQFNQTLRAAEAKKILVASSWVKANDATQYVYQVSSLAVSHALPEELVEIEEVLDTVAFAAYSRRNPTPPDLKHKAVEFLGAPGIPYETTNVQDLVLDTLEVMPPQEDITDIEIPEAFIEPAPSFDAPSADFDFNGGNGDF